MTPATIGFLIFSAFFGAIAGMFALYRAGARAGRVKGYKDAQEKAARAMEEAWKYARSLRGDNDALTLAEAPPELLVLWAQWESDFGTERGGLSTRV